MNPFDIKKQLQCSDYLLFFIKFMYLTYITSNVLNPQVVMLPGILS